MTPLVASLLCFLATAAGPTGAYRPHDGVAEKWQINNHGCLIWEGEPYLPIGARISGSPETIQTAASAGVKDAIVELPASGVGWQEAFEALERKKMRYLIAIDSLAPMAKGVAVDPAGYRIDGIKEKQHIDLDLPGTTSVLAVFVTRPDGAVESTKRIPTPDGRLSYDLEPMNDLEHVLLLYPEQTSLEQPDFWDELDSHRDTLIGSFRRTPPGKGLRGLVDPLGSLVRLSSRGLRFVPTNPYFRLELASYLQTKYTSLETALKSWSMSSSDVDSFERMARLVPLWAGARGVSQLWDPTTDKLYLCDSKASLIWRDLQGVVDAAADRRFRRLVTSVREAANVPIIQDFSGWSSAYEGSDPAVDGVGLRVDTSSPSRIADEASRGISAVLRWSKPGWCPATRIELGKDSASLASTLDDLTSLGTRGWFVKTETPEGLKAVATEAASRSNMVALAQDSPSPIFFPEAALNPASPQRLPGGYWWLPSPSPGNRIDMGEQYFAYRLVDTTGSTFALWRNGPAKRDKLRLLAPKQLKIRTLDGSDPKPKFTKAGLEITITQYPVLLTGVDEIPVPETALNETVLRFDQLTKFAEANQKDITDDIYYFKDSLNGFERNPGGSFSTLRLVLRRLTQRLAPFVWIEGESSSATNFSEPILIAGCNNGSALQLRTALSGRHYFAEYEVPVRSQDVQQIWIAARIPSSLREYVSLTVGGQTMALSGDGTGFYGDRFAWYKFGTTKLAGGKYKLRIEVDAKHGADMAIDAIVLSPGEFHPNGVNLPGATG